MSFQAYVIVNRTTNQYIPDPYSSPESAEAAITMLELAQPMFEYDILKFSHTDPKWTMETFTEWLKDNAKKSVN